MSQLNSSELMAFQAILSFVSDINGVFGTEQKSLALYGRLIEKTTFAHIEAIRKHISAFKVFCTDSRDALREKNSSKLSTQNIQYSDRVFINLRSLFMKADTDSKRAIWNHILTISAIVDPAAKMREVLETESGESGESAGNQDFLQGLISQVEDNIDTETSNPTEAMTNLMKSGVMENMMVSMTQGMQDGSLDLGGLMGSIQGMVGNLREQEGIPPEVQHMTQGLSQALSQVQSQIEDTNKEE